MKIIAVIPARYESSRFQGKPLAEICGKLMIERVYLQAKKKQTARGLDKYVCEGEENLRDISQRFAVSLKSIRKLNNIQGNPILREGDVIKLRK